MILICCLSKQDNMKLHIDDAFYQEPPGTYLVVNNQLLFKLSVSNGNAPPSPVNRHPDPEAVLRFRVRRLEPFPPEPDPEVQILAALAHQAPAEAEAEAVPGLVVAALAPSSLHIQAEHHPRTARLLKTPAKHRLASVLRQSESQHRRARVAAVEHREPVAQVRLQPPPIQIVVVG